MVSRKQVSRLVMRSSTVGLLVLSGILAFGQQTTTANTNCNLYGNTASCTNTSKSTDYGAQQQRPHRRSAVEVIRNPETAKISRHLAERSKREHPPAAAAHGQGTGPSPIAIAY